MQFATQIGPLPYSWKIITGAVSGSSIIAQIEIADASGTVHAVPDEYGNPTPTFSVEVSTDPSVDNQALIDGEYSKIRQRLWLIEAGNATAVFTAIVQQGVRRSL